MANNSSHNAKSSYMSKGFAYVYSDLDFINKITTKKFNNNELLIGHSFLTRGTVVKVVKKDCKFWPYLQSYWYL